MHQTWLKLRVDISYGLDDPSLATTVVEMYFHLGAITPALLFSILSILKYIELVILQQSSKF